MGYFRFHRMINLLPGVRMNFSKGGPSFSFGFRGARVNVGARGVRTTVGVPGSGLSAIHYQGWSKAKPTAHPLSMPPAVPMHSGRQETTCPDKTPVVDSAADPVVSAQSPRSELLRDTEARPRAPHLYAATEKWYPIIARSRTDERLPQWLIEIEQEYREDGYDRHAYELRRRIILAEMAARGRGVRPRPMTKREQEELRREFMTATVADETGQPFNFPQRSAQ